MMLDAMDDWLGLDHPYKRMGLLSSDWFANGGSGVFDQLTTSDSIQSVVDYFKSLPLYIKLDHEVNGLPVVVSHTCLNNYSYDILNATQEDLRSHATSFVWSRSQANDNTGAFFNIYGHTPTDYIGIKNSQPLVTKFGVNLDTGCVYQSEGRGVLTGILLPSCEIIQQERL